MSYPSVSTVVCLLEGNRFPARGSRRYRPHSANHPVKRRLHGQSVAPCALGLDRPLSYPRERRFSESQIPCASGYSLSKSFVRNFIVALILIATRGCYGSLRWAVDRYADSNVRQNGRQSEATRNLSAGISYPRFSLIIACVVCARVSTRCKCFAIAALIISRERPRALEGIS